MSGQSGSLQDPMMLPGQTISIQPNPMETRAGSTSGAPDTFDLKGAMAAAAFMDSQTDFPAVNHENQLPNPSMWEPGMDTSSEMPAFFRGAGATDMPPKTMLDYANKTFDGMVNSAGGVVDEIGQEAGLGNTGFQAGESNTFPWDSDWDSMSAPKPAAKEYPTKETQLYDQNKAATARRIEELTQQAKSMGRNSSPEMMSSERQAEQRFRTRQQETVGTRVSRAEAKARQLHLTASGRFSFFKTLDQGLASLANLSLGISIAKSIDSQAHRLEAARQEAKRSAQRAQQQKLSQFGGIEKNTEVRQKMAEQVDDTELSSVHG